MGVYKATINLTVWGLQLYLFRQLFTKDTDHSPLTWLHHLKGTNIKLMWWMEPGFAESRYGSHSC